MQVLLWIEELQHEVDIRQYDMENAQLTLRHGGLVGLEVSECLSAVWFGLLICTHFLNSRAAD